MFSSPDEQRASITYYSQATALYDPSTGSGYGADAADRFRWANFFIGVSPATTTPRPREGRFSTRRAGTQAYFQDNFKATSRLTLNIGLRYESMPATSRKGTTCFSVSTQDQIHRHRHQPSKTCTGWGSPRRPRCGRTSTSACDSSPRSRPAGRKESSSSYRLDFGPRRLRLQSSVPAATSVVRGGYSMFRHPFQLRYYRQHARTIRPSRIRAYHLAHERQLARTERPIIGSPFRSHGDHGRQEHGHPRHPERATSSWHSGSLVFPTRSLPPTAGPTSGT